jgi:hypothetical protein
LTRALVALLLLSAAPARADDWTIQTSGRLTLGGGAYIPESAPQGTWPLFETGLRGDLMIGEARPARVRFGPMLDLRTEDFRTFELAGALAVLFPLDAGFTLTLNAGAGWGARPEDRDGALALGIVSVGWRPYNYFGLYGWTVQLYGAARVQLENDRVWEVTIGLEIDFEILFVIPFMFLWELAEARDPDEPLEPDAEY